MPDSISGIGPSQALTELFGLTGKLPLQLEGFIVPVVQIGDLDKAVQWGPLAMGLCYQPAGGAANNNKVEISLPIANQTVGLRALIETVDIYVGLATSLHIRVSPGLAAPTHFAVKAWADNRKRGAPQVLLNGKNNTPPGAVFGFHHATLLAGDHFHLDLGWILGENAETGVQQGILIESNTLNTSMTVNVRWREGAPR